MKNVLPGVKTYIVSLGIILLGVGAWAHGDLSLMQAADQILAGLGLGALRMGVASTKP